MTHSKKCPQCNSQLPADAPAGICPKCVMQLGMATDPTIARTHANAANFQPPAPEKLAASFPQLEIVELIGQGGMGAVYKARQRGLDRLVALKILAPEISRDPSFSERFLREARALARLDHPNIVGVHDSGQAGDYFYLLMEYVDGMNLRQAVHHATLATHEALAIVPQICDALQFAHDAGIVHRDIKPENVLLDKAGSVKVADFGLAKLTKPEVDQYTLTGTHQVMGTPRYMAPEQIEHTREVDHRADIYSLGVVFYELLTGELPLGRFAVPSKKVQVDVRLDEVVLRTLEKEPELRYQRASEIRTDVDSICNEKPNHRSPKKGRDRGSNATGSFHPHRRSRALPGCLIALVIGALFIPCICLLPPAFYASRAKEKRGNALAKSRVAEAIATELAMSKQMDSDPLLPNEEKDANVRYIDGEVRVTDAFVQAMVLTASQRKQIDKTLTKLHGEYIELEKQNRTAQVNESGHQVTTIKPFTDGIQKLNDDFWSDIDPVLSVEQQSRLRLNLQLTASENRSGYIYKIVMPGVFGWGGEKASVEIWKSGQWFHWKIKANIVTHTDRGPKLPTVYERFWREDVEAENSKFGL